MKPRANLLNFEDARQTLLASATPLSATETLPLLAALGRTLAQSIQSPINVPGFDNSAMDGYALNVLDMQALPESFPVTQRIAAGQTGTSLASNTAARIFTGAPVPEGANVVVPQEHTQDHEGSIALTHPIERMQHIRRKGEDISEGSLVLSAGQRLGAPHLAMLASIGVATATVFKPLKVGVFFTGDELTEPGQILAPGAIYNSNRYAINALLVQLGCLVNDYGIVRDSAEATREALSKAASENDVIITCGGVSVGEEDHVKAAVMALGSLDLWQISMKPGKPLAYGRVGHADFIGLPGNPVSSFVTFLLMARPFLLKRMGSAHTELKYLSATANFNWPKPDRRREFLRVKISHVASGAPVLDLWPNQGSGVMSSLAWADGLVDIASDTKVARGDVVRYLSLSELLY
ncbi:MAG: molybdopterin molybdotransferase MoeA [Burkholderiaceae bacterium]|nr:molybdopterin molybdotransferase MoeA [Burkholderiaceae bacterium]